MKTRFISDIYNKMPKIQSKGNKVLKGSGILLTASLAALPMISNAQNKNINEAFDKFVYEEFTKADNNPADYYINQEELDEYSKESQHKIASFDKTGDGKLNIDEFKSLIKTSLGINNSSQGSNTTGQAQNPTSSQSNNIFTSENMFPTNNRLQTNKPYQTNNTTTSLNSIIEKTKNAKAIISEIESALEPIVITKPNGEKCRVIDEKAVLNAYRKITPDNLKEILDAEDKLLIARLWHYSIFRFAPKYRKVSDQTYIEARRIIGNVYKEYFRIHNYSDESAYDNIDEWIKMKLKDTTMAWELASERICCRHFAEINK